MSGEIEPTAGRQDGEGRGDDRCHSLDEVLDGELSPPVADRLRRHLAECPECAAEIERARAVRLLLQRSCARDTAPTSLRERITVEYRRVSITMRTTRLS